MEAINRFSTLMFECNTDSRVHHRVMQERQSEEYPAKWFMEIDEMMRKEERALSGRQHAMSGIVWDLVDEICEEYRLGYYRERECDDTSEETGDTEVDEESETVL